jgi:hypothetical protein
MAQFVFDALLTAIVAVTPPMEIEFMKYEPAPSTLMAAHTTTSLSSDAVPIAVPVKLYVYTLSLLKRDVTYVAVALPPSSGELTGIRGKLIAGPPH